MSEVSTTELTILPEDEERRAVFMFKSKYRDDCITLRKPMIERLPDGSKSFQAAQVAQFDRNTWITEDPEEAALLRNAITTRQRLRSDLGVWEVTEPSNIAVQED